MSAVPPIRSVMTVFPHFIAANARASDARKMMAERRIRHLPVMDGGRLCGIVSERDLRLLLGTGSGMLLESRTDVGDVCHRDVYAVDVNEPLDKVLAEMAERHVGSALVLREGELVGIFTTTDACRLFAAHLRGERGV